MDGGNTERRNSMKCCNQRVVETSVSSSWAEMFKQERGNTIAVDV